MIPIDMKIETRRRALAEGFLRCSAEALGRLKANDLPKPDVLATARAAALMASKRVPDLLPHCHPLLLEQVRVDFHIHDDGIRMEAEVWATAKTGVEMEALTALQVGLLTIYDMLKCVDKNMEMSGTKLVEKDGGKSDFEPHLKPGFLAAVLVSSDRVSRGQAEDKTGTWLKKSLEDFGVQNVAYKVLPDEPDQMEFVLNSLCEAGTDLVITTGGTGLSPRDRTVEAARRVIERELPGAMEAARAFGQRRTPYAMLSRGVAGVKGKTLIVTLPGSQAGVKESFAAIYPYLFHAHHVLAQSSPAPKEVSHAH
jgi:molybdenum cofactor biosynthesis protein MoaC